MILKITLITKAFYNKNNQNRALFNELFGSKNGQKYLNNGLILMTNSGHKMVTISHCVIIVHQTNQYISFGSEICAQANF